ncbi:MAG TPA: Lrp/AsnC ligand binding domain-containing protein [Thermoplasmata archaeon]|nr:Lrp/AsnC ligand binding domain-containing protein [Thermoplasmata archaeon]
MPEAANRELTLYVQSRKAVTTFYRPPASDLAPGSSLGVASATRSAGHSDEDAPGSGEEVYFLSDEQARCVAVTEEVAASRQYKVKVVDVAKAGLVERIVTERLRGVQKFPVLIAPDGKRLEGPQAFNVDDLAELMPTDSPKMRAFTYLKVRGGDFERIRESLLKFDEVRELHFLTGDWDIFALLEFPESSKKRQVLDFVTDRIRGIADVIDTSTLVPEYSVTKLPFSTRVASPDS